MDEARLSEEELAAQRQHGEEVSRDLAARTLTFQEAIAERLGLTLSDHRCLELVDRWSQHGPVTAGKLAELTGLTTGAITGVIDRLERAGFVRREKAPEDRRQVQIKLVPDRKAEMEALFEPMAESFSQLCKEHSTEELETIWRFLRRVCGIYQQETDLLRNQQGGGQAAPDGFEEISAPLGLHKLGRFELTRGAANMTLGSMGGNLLYRARFQGPAPRMRVENGQVALEYNHSALRLFSLRKHSLKLDLNEKIPWDLALRGGASKVSANLQNLQVRSLELKGGASQVSIALPSPSDTVSVRVTGGSSQLKLLRPRNIPARVQVTGGVCNLCIDKLELGSVGGTTRWESPDYEASRDRYDIQISGGASQLSILQD